MKRLLALLAILVVTATAASAHEYTLKDLQINHPFANATPAGTTSGAGYLSIKNTGSEDDRLVSVDVPTLSKKTEIHTMEMDGTIARMRPVEGGVVIPAGQTVEFKPSGLHVMFVDILAPLTAGQEFPATLRFEKSGEIGVVFNIEAPGGMPEGHDHKDHGHKGMHEGHDHEHGTPAADARPAPAKYPDPVVIPEPKLPEMSNEQHKAPAGIAPAKPLTPVVAPKEFAKPEVLEAPAATPAPSPAPATSPVTAPTQN